MTEAAVPSRVSTLKRSRRLVRLGPGRAGSVLGVAVALAACRGTEASPPGEERVREGRQTAAPLGNLPPAPARPPMASTVARGAHRGQELYLPVYSSVFGRDEAWELKLTVTVSIRNTSDAQVSLERLDYIGTKGHLLEHVVQQPVKLGPLETREYVIRTKDTRGGVGANFMVEWRAAQPVTAPVIQAVHVYLTGNQNFAFVTSARVLREIPKGR